jgi:hypothetical protein
MPEIKMLRDVSTPEARALGGWYARIEYQTPRGPVATETDYCRTREGAIVAALGLAFRLGVPVQGARDAFDRATK